MVGSLFSANSLLTNRSTTELFPTAASPSKTSFVWKGLGAAVGAVAESAMMCCGVEGD